MIALKFEAHFTWLSVVFYTLVKLSAAEVEKQSERPAAMSINANSSSSSSSSTTASASPNDCCKQILLLTSRSLSATTFRPF